MKHQNRAHDFNETEKNDLQELQQVENAAYGADKYTVRSIRILVKSLFRLTSAVNESSAETKSTINHLTRTIEDLDAKNSKLQKITLWLSILASIFALLSLIQVVEILRQWLNLW